MSQETVSRGRVALLLVLGAMLVFGNCKFNSAPPQPTIYFGADEGISYRSDQDAPNGPQDGTDWTLDINWDTPELNLFSGLGLDVNATAQGTATNISAYPNPSAAAATFHCSTPAAAAYQVVVVDEKYQVTYRQAFPATTSLVVPLQLRGLAKGRYRLYYLLYNGSSVYFKGHGDIKVE